MNKQDRTIVRELAARMADDHSAFISDPIYRQHVMPYNMAIYGRYGLRERHLHADGPNDHHFQTYAEIVRLTSMDIGGFWDIARAKPVFAGRVACLVAVLLLPYLVPGQPRARREKCTYPCGTAIYPRRTCALSPS